VENSTYIYSGALCSLFLVEFIVRSLALKPFLEGSESMSLLFKLEKKTINVCYFKKQNSPALKLVEKTQGS
jgi:hypothetical protein